MLRSGGKSRQGPCARSAARVPATSAAGAPAASWRHHWRVQHQTCQPLRFDKRSHTKRGNLGSNSFVEWLYYSKRIIIVRWADLSGFFSVIFVGKMCVCVSRPMKIVTFLRKNDYPPKRVVDFPLERDTFRNKIMEIVEDFYKKSYNNNGKPWKSSRILRVNLIFSFFFLFSFF